MKKEFGGMEDQRGEGSLTIGIAYGYRQEVCISLLCQCIRGDVISRGRSRIWGGRGGGGGGAGGGG